MPDQITVVTSQNWFQRLGNSIKSVLIGLLFFVGSFVVLYMNEGRVDISRIAAKAAIVDPSAVTTNATLQGKLVSVSGPLSAGVDLGDGAYLKDGDYLAIERNVEMYAWEEKSKSSSSRSTGGGETTTTTYSYVKTWTADPESSSGFKESAGHVNPAMPIKGLDKTVDAAIVGAYGIDMRGITVRGTQPLQLSADNVGLSGGASLSGDHVFLGKGSLAAPEIGDVRVSYKVFPAGVSGTVFGQLSGDKITPFFSGQSRVHYIYAGSHEAALSQMHGEYNTLLWILRVVGFLLMWIGLMMILGPLSVFLDVLPILGSVSRGAVTALTLVVSIALSLLTIIISRLLHSPLAILIALALGAAAIILILKRGKRAAVPVAPSPSDSSQPPAVS